MSDENRGDAIRREIEALLQGGLDTAWQDRADSHQDTQRILAALRASDGSLESKLRIAGFTLRPVEHGGLEQACETCMYYLVHRRYCELPELDLPALPEWSCNLWRV